jgi:hypothetical protein
MPPRYSYWTILAGGLPTAFRATERDELLPTFRRIRDKHPDAEMKWFARGRLWASPEAAQEDLKRARERRARDWRPGGDHRDPRQKYKDAKQARNLSWRKEKFERKLGAAGDTRRPPGDRSRGPGPRPHRDATPRGQAPAAAPARTPQQGHSRPFKRDAKPRSPHSKPPARFDEKAPESKRRRRP